MRWLGLPLILSLFVPLAYLQFGSVPINAASTFTSITVSIDAAGNVHPISPLIYGIANSSGATSWQKDMGASLIRWGGNARTRHNWEMNASNAGSDWDFNNLDQANGDRTPGKASVKFVSANKSLGLESLLTMPTIGWVAKDTTPS